jgi:hypothetical protein
MKPESSKNPLEQIYRLYDRLVYWLHERQDARRARNFARRLAQVLAKLGPEAGTIFGEECQSLIHEANGELPKAIEHREEEMRLIRRLHELAQGPDAARADYILGQYNCADLRDRLELLAILYHDSGDLDKALGLLEAAKQLCLERGIPFDAEDTLNEYLGERPSKTLYLWVSENGVLSGREASGGLEATMPSANVASIEQVQGTARPAKLVSRRATERPAVGGSVVAIEDD